MLRVAALFRGVAFHVKQDPCGWTSENFEFPQSEEWTQCDVSLGSTWNMTEAKREAREFHVERLEQDSQHRWRST